MREVVNLENTARAHVEWLFKGENCVVTQRFSGSDAIPNFVASGAFLPLGPSAQ